MPRKRPPGAGARTRPAPTSSTRRSAESSRRRSVAGPATDPLEDLFARGLTDGLPVVPPTRARVQRALDRAGCRPEYLPVVIAAVEAVCDERFDLHGVSATTNAPAPLVVVNGPVRQALDINCGAGVFGPGWRANATIGRALRLVCVNLGGAVPGLVSMSTFAH